MRLIKPSEQVCEGELRGNELMNLALSLSPTCFPSSGQWRNASFSCSAFTEAVVVQTQEPDCVPQKTEH